MFSRRFALVLSLAAMSFASPDAEAKKSKSTDTSAVIEPTGVKEFDDIFTQVKDIHTDLAAMETQIKSSRENVATALGLAKETTFADSFAELKKRGAGKLTVALDDKKLPTLKAEDAAPDDVKTAASKVNDSSDALAAAKDRLPSIQKNTLELKDQVVEFPGKVDKDLMKKNDLGVTDLPKVLSKTKSDASITASTPARAEAVGSEIAAYFESLSSAFTGANGVATTPSATPAATETTTTTTTTTSTTTEPAKKVIGVSSGHRPAPK
jgi:hypothetical protein